MAVGGAHVGWAVTTSTQSTEPGVRIRARGTAAAEEGVCKEGQPESAPTVVAGKPLQGLFLRRPKQQLVIRQHY